MSIKLPDISLLWVFATIDDNKKFHLFPSKDYDMGEAMHRNLTGGLSLVFHHFQIKENTFIHGDETNTVRMVIDFDANTLYL